jgi:hypothetical protein
MMLNIYAIVGSGFSMGLSIGLAVILVGADSFELGFVDDEMQK